MPPALVAQLIQIGVSGSTIPDIRRRAGLSGTNLVVSSNRLEIVHRSATAGTAYTPPPELRRDEVTVTCLDNRPRFAVDCERVVVFIDDKAVPPLRSTGGERTLSDEHGAVWQKKGVEAAYPAAALKNGFVVTAVAPDRQSWTLVVTAEEAAERLLLGALPAAL
jgi:hypothetical protein